MVLATASGESPKKSSPIVADPDEISDRAGLRAVVGQQLQSPCCAFGTYSG